MVCMGNICRSPTAQGVLRQRAQGAALPVALHVDSAGTHDYHVGCAPDRRSIAAAQRRGIDISGLRARQLTQSDFEAFDLVLVMDERNLRDARALAPPALRSRVQLLLDYAPELRDSEVPDPYYEDTAAFERVLDLCEAASAGVLEAIRDGSLAPR